MGDIEIVHPKHQSTEEVALPQTRECRCQPFCLGSFFGVVKTGFFDGFGLGLFDKGSVGKAACKGIAFLGGGVDGFGDAGALGVQVDDGFFIIDTWPCGPALNLRAPSLLRMKFFFLFFFGTLVLWVNNFDVTQSTKAPKRLRYPKRASAAVNRSASAAFSA